MLLGGVGNSAASSTVAEVAALPSVLVSEQMGGGGLSPFDPLGKYNSLAIVITKPEKPPRERQPHDRGNEEKPVEKRAVVSVHG